MFLLRLNPIRGRAEDSADVARAETREALLTFLERERVEPYQEADPDGPEWYQRTWHKVFRKGGPLEWYNPPPPDGAPGTFGHGIIDVGTLDWHIERARRRAQAEWDGLLRTVPLVTAPEKGG